MANKRRRWLIYGLSTLLSIGGLLFLLRSFDVERLKVAFNTVDYRFFALSLTITTVSQIIPALRWQVLLDGKIRLRHSTGAIWIGNFISALVPLRMGEAARAGLIYRSERIPLATSLSTIIAGQVMDVVSLLALALLLLLTAPLPPELMQASVIMAVLTVAGLLGVVLLLRFVPAASTRIEPLLLSAFGGKFHQPVKGLFKKMMQAVRVLQNPTRLSYALGLSLGFWLITSLAGAAMVLSLRQDQILVLGLMVAFAGGIGRLLPAMPGSIGTLDAATLLGLRALGVGETDALALVLLLRLRYTVMVSICGLIGFAIEGRFSLRPPAVAETTE